MDCHQQAGKITENPPLGRSVGKLVDGQSGG